MVLPNKSFTLSKSLIGTGALILEHLRKGEENNVDKMYKKILDTHSIDFKYFTLTCTFLYTMGIIEIDNDNIRLTK